jgi:hypothetical protein
MNKICALCFHEYNVYSKTEFVFGMCRVFKFVLSYRLFYFSHKNGGIAVCMTVTHNFYFSPFVLQLATL